MRLGRAALPHRPRTRSRNAATRARGLRATPAPLRGQPGVPRDAAGGGHGPLGHLPRRTARRDHRAARSPVLRGRTVPPGAPSRPTRPHPLFRDFVGAAQTHRRTRAERDRHRQAEPARRRWRTAREPTASRTAFQGTVLRLDVEQWPGHPPHEVDPPSGRRRGPPAPARRTTSCSCSSSAPRSRQTLTEIPAGVLDIEGEDALTCAARELFEETGYRHRAIEFLRRLLRIGRASPTSTSTCSGRAPKPSPRATPRTASRWSGCRSARWSARRAPGKVRDAKTALALLLAAGATVVAGGPPSRASRLSRLRHGTRRVAPVIVGVPTEVKDNEYRVAATPEGVRELVHAGSRRSSSRPAAGVGSALPDERLTSGRRRDPRRTPTRSSPRADMILKVKEPHRRGVRALPRGPDPVHVPAPGRRRDAHAVPARAQGRRASRTRPSSCPTAACRCSRR